MQSLRLPLLAATLALASTAQAYEFWAVNTTNQLVRYDSAAPGTALFSTGITGLFGFDGVTPDAFGQITDLTFANGSLYGLDTNANLYTINTGTGAATLVSSTFAPSGFDLGLAYDPFISGGGFRVVTDLGENFSATLGGSFTAGNDVYVASGDVNDAATLAISGLAIDVDFGIGWAFDAHLDTLFVTYDANFEEFFTVGELGGDFTALASLDFVDESTLLAALSTDSFVSELYTIDPTTGTATLVGSFGDGITAIAVNSSAIPEPASAAALFGLAVLGLAVLRRGRRAA